MFKKLKEGEFLRAEVTDKCFTIIDDFTDDAIQLGWKHLPALKRIVECLEEEKRALDENSR